MNLAVAFRDIVVMPKLKEKVTLLSIWAGGGQRVGWALMQSRYSSGMREFVRFRLRWHQQLRLAENNSFDKTHLMTENILTSCLFIPPVSTLR
jgi:hypothetical protein